jgi:hypothetical protein
MESRSLVSLTTKNLPTMTSLKDHSEVFIKAEVRTPTSEILSLASLHSSLPGSRIRCLLLEVLEELPSDSRHPAFGILVIVGLGLAHLSPAVDSQLVLDAPHTSWLRYQSS